MAAIENITGKFRRQTETREQLLDRFVGSRPAKPTISEEEILDEVRAVKCNP
jgi:hypothetical protein